MTYLAGGANSFLLAEYFPADEASVDITGVITTDFEAYDIVGWLEPAFPNADLHARLSSDNGATWLSDTAYMANENALQGTWASWANVQLNNRTAFVLSDSAGGGLGTPTRYAQVSARLNRPTDGGVYTTLRATPGSIQGDAAMWWNTYANVRRVVESHNAIQLYFHNGNILTGEIKIYGVEQ